MLLTVLSVFSGCLRAGYETPSEAHDASALVFDTRVDIGDALRDVFDSRVAATDALEVDSGVRGDAAAYRQSLAITHDLDDGEIVYQWNDQWLPQGERETHLIFIGSFASGGVPVWGYFRFGLDAPIAAGSIITDARLILRGHSTYLWDAAVDKLVIGAELRADAMRVRSEEDRPGGANGTLLTTASVRWPEAGGLNWDSAGDNISPNLAPLLQELIEQYDLFAGSHIQLWLHNPDNTGDAEVAAEDFSFASGAGAHARLQIVWTR